MLAVEGYETMNKSSRRTTIAAAIGGVALTATAVGAVAMTGDTPEPTPEPSVSQSAPQDSGRIGDGGSCDDSTAAQSGGVSRDQSEGVSRDQAVEIAERALAEYGEVPPLDEIEREHEHGRAIWDVEFGDDHEVYVDIETGDVVRIDIDDDRYDD